MIELVIALYVPSQIVALAIALYFHVAISWVTARTYRAAYKIDPLNKRWPKWYINSRWMWIYHLGRGLIRPWETVGRFGHRWQNSLVRFDFARLYPRGEAVEKKDKVIVDNVLP